MPFLTKEQLNKIGFAKLGEHVFISDKASFHNPAKISLGSYVRIDDFCVFSAGEDGIELSDFVHIGCFSSLIGQAKIKIGNYSGVSSKVAIYSSSDDFSGHSLPGIQVIIPDEFRHLTNKPVIFEDHTGVGTLSVVFPGVTIREGAMVGALSLIRKSLKPWSIYSGNPLRFIKSRSQEMLKFIPELEKMRKEGLLKDYDLNS